MKKLKLVVAMVIGLMTVVGVAFAATFIGTNLLGFNSVVSPSNMLDTDDDYALFEYVNNGVCPPGDFTGSGACTEADSGKRVRPWAIIGYNSTIINATAIGLKGSNMDDGCAGAGCGDSIATNVFTTDDYTGNLTDWVYQATIWFDFNETAEREISIDADVDAVLVGRGASGNNKPDVRVMWVTVEN